MGDGGASDTEDEAGAWGLFDEPDGFRPKTPPPTEVVQRLHDGSDVRLRLVGSHPLWGHYLWNAAPTMATYLQEHADRYNLAHNLTHNACTHATAHGYIWGADAAPLRALVPHDYDVVLMSDLIFNHQAHEALLDTCDACLTRDAARAPCALVFFSHHRPHLAEKDAHFFTRAGARGYGCEKIGEWHLEPMFPEDPGDARVRATVHGWLLTRVVS
ncbi:EFM7 [Malassezia furfur]|nr:EFM7 [Malassezia furfur]